MTSFDCPICGCVENKSLRLLCTCCCIFTLYSPSPASQALIKSAKPRAPSEEKTKGGHRYVELRLSTSLMCVDCITGMEEAANKVDKYDYNDNANPSAPDPETGEVKTLLNVPAKVGHEAGKENLEATKGVKAVEWEQKDRQLLVTTTIRVPPDDLIAAALPAVLTLAANIGVHLPGYTTKLKCHGCSTKYGARTLGAIKSGEFFVGGCFFAPLDRLERFEKGTRGKRTKDIAAPAPLPAPSSPSPPAPSPSTHSPYSCMRKHVRSIFSLPLSLDPGNKLAYAVDFAFHRKIHDLLNPSADDGTRRSRQAHAYGEIAEDLMSKDPKFRQSVEDGECAKKMAEEEKAAEQERRRGASVGAETDQASLALARQLGEEDEANEAQSRAEKHRRDEEASKEFMRKLEKEQGGGGGEEGGDEQASQDLVRQLLPAAEQKPQRKKSEVIDLLSSDDDKPPTTTTTTTTVTTASSADRRAKGGKKRNAMDFFGAASNKK